MFFQKLKTNRSSFKFFLLLKNQLKKMESTKVNKCETCKGTIDNEGKPVEESVRRIIVINSLILINLQMLQLILLLLENTRYINF
jgi:hypothetical protein